jgi:hypothetical protein
VLTPALYDQMVSPGTVAGGRRTRCGMGVALSDVAGRPAVHHGGDIDGFTTFTAYLPAGSLNLTVLLNAQGPTRPDAIAAAICRGLPRASAAAGARPGTARFDSLRGQVRQRRSLVWADLVVSLVHWERAE